MGSPYLRLQLPGYVTPFKILSHHGVTARSFSSVCGVVGSEPRWLQSVAVSSETDAAVTWMEAVRTSKLK